MAMLVGVAAAVEEDLLAVGESQQVGVGLQLGNIRNRLLQPGLPEIRKDLSHGALLSSIGWKECFL